MRRVEMRSPASSGVVRVPEGQVEQFKARGWRLAEASKPKPKKKVVLEESADADQE